MKTQKLSLLLLLSMSYQAKPFDQKLLNEELDKRFTRLQGTLEKQNALLEEQNKLTKALLTCMLHNARQEEALLEETKKTMAAEAALDQQKQQRRQQLIQEQQNKPWYQKAWDTTSKVVTVYLIHSLWPAVKSQITVRLADKTVQVLFNGVDIATGDWVEKQWGPRYACRPGEWLLKTPTGYEQAQTKRNISRNYPDIEELAKERDELKKAVYPDALRNALENEISALKKFRDRQSQRHTQDQEQQAPTDDAPYASLYHRYISGQPIVEEPTD